MSYSQFNLLPIHSSSRFLPPRLNHQHCRSPSAAFSSFNHSHPFCIWVLKISAWQKSMAHNQPYDPYFLQQHHLQQQQDMSDWAAINTLFVSGLPDDVKAREIHNLFRRRPGFESCQLKYTGRGNQVVAFATFFNHQSAIAAMHALNGVKFDPQTGSVLHIELARSNSRRKRKPGNGPYVVIDNRTETAAANAQETSSEDGDNDADDASKSYNVDSNKVDSVTMKSETKVDHGNAIVSVNEPSEKTLDGGLGVQPCSTLFIANLGPNCSEDELRQALSQYPGFSILKMRAKSGMPVAFADFKEIEQAAKVMKDLQGSLLPSSDRGGMHIEYARSKMRKH